MNIDTQFLNRCFKTLEVSFAELQQFTKDEVAYDIRRAACVKEFELILEQSSALLRKRIGPFCASHEQVDRLYFKDVFRHAARHGLISVASCRRWLEYREHRNDTAHNHGQEYAEATRDLLPQFLVDARDLARVIAGGEDD